VNPQLKQQALSAPFQSLAEEEFLPFPNQMKELSQGGEIQAMLRYMAHEQQVQY
jgi:hypothetical protein